MKNVYFKHRILSLFALTVVVTAFFSFTLTVTDGDHKVVNDPCSLANTTFKSGEKLVYKLYYNWKFIWVPAGEVVFTVSESPESYEIKAIGKTYRSYENIFKVNDYFYSKVNKETMLPSNFVRIIEEGNYKVYDSIRFDQARKVALSYHGKSKSEAKQQLHQVNQCMQDMVSNIYRMRNIDTDLLKNGESIPTHMFFDKEIFPINVHFKGKERKDIKEMGTFNTIKMIPDVVEGNVFKKGDHMTIWVSDDKNKIPLLIESPVSVGSIKVVLKSHSGLKYEMGAKIND